MVLFQIQKKDISIKPYSFFFHSVFVRFHGVGERAWGGGLYRCLKAYQNHWEELKEH